MSISSRSTSSAKRDPHKNLLLRGDCRTLLKTLAPDSVDLVCTDPPYGIGFMGNEWDTFELDYLKKKLAAGQGHHGSVASIAGKYDYRKNGHFQDFIRTCATEWLRVLKPGAFVFMTMAPRQDVLSRAMMGLEEAGFKTGFTSLYWTYASGFPKAKNIGKIADRRAGAVRKGIVRKGAGTRGNSFRLDNRYETGLPVTAKAKALDGAYGGFQPKPAVEVVIVAMKPLSEKTYVDQALKNGKGVTWLDDGRIPIEAGYKAPVRRKSFHDGRNNAWLKIDKSREAIAGASEQGRFPANLLVSDDILNGYSSFFSMDKWAQLLPFLIVPKANKREKDCGLGEEYEERQFTGGGGTYNAEAAGKYGSIKSAKKNTHPTVKPLKLMSYLITLGSRPGDVVLDPFLGSGTTAIAAKLLGRRYIGIERERAYLSIARNRLKHVQPGVIRKTPD